MSFLSKAPRELAGCIECVALRGMSGAAARLDLDVATSASSSALLLRHAGVAPAPPPRPYSGLRELWARRERGAEREGGRKKGREAECERRETGGGGRGGGRQMVALRKSPPLPRARGIAESHPKTLSKDETLGKQVCLSRATQKLSAKPKHSANRPLCRKHYLGSWQENFKNHFLKSKHFVSSTYTCTKLMFRFGTILAMFSKFNNFTSF
jgi:hypothetical protein